MGLAHDLKFRSYTDLNSYLEPEGWGKQGGHVMTRSAAVFSCRLFSGKGAS